MRSNNAFPLFSFLIIFHTIKLRSSSGRRKKKEENFLLRTSSISRRFHFLLKVVSKVKSISKEKKIFSFFFTKGGFDGVFNAVIKEEEDGKKRGFFFCRE